MSVRPRMALAKKLAMLTVLVCLLFAGTAAPATAVPVSAAIEDPAPADPLIEPLCTEITCAIAGVDLDDPAVLTGVQIFQPGATGVVGYPTSSSYLDGCTFELVEAGDSVTARPGGGSSNLDGVTWSEDYWVIFCDPGGLAYTFYPDGDPPPVPVIQDMIADAFRRTPVVAFSPITSPDGDDDIELVVRMPTYLWVDDVAWQTPVSASSTAPGGFTITSTAIPELATWSGGDEPDVCTGDQMIPYDFNRDEDNQRSECFMIYKRSSAVGTQTVDLAVTWDVNYTCSIPGVCGGPLPDLTTRSTREVTIVEILAVNS